MSDADLLQIENAHAVLKLRQMGAADMVPKKLAHFTDKQLAAAIMQAALRLHIGFSATEEEGAA